MNEILKPQTPHILWNDYLIEWIIPFHFKIKLCEFEQRELGALKRFRSPILI